MRLCMRLLYAPPTPTQLYLLPCFLSTPRHRAPPFLPLLPTVPDDCALNPPPPPATVPGATGFVPATSHTIPTPLAVLNVSFVLAVACSRPPLPPSACHLVRLLVYYFRYNMYLHAMRLPQRGPMGRQLRLGRHWSKTGRARNCRHRHSVRVVPGAHYAVRCGTASNHALGTSNSSHPNPGRALRAMPQQ